MTKDRFKKIGFILLLILLVLQFIQIHPNQGNSEKLSAITHVINLPPQIEQTLKSSCYDCHSNHTNYPWYSYIQPIGFWLNHHVNEGKEELNFDEFANYKIKKQIHKLEETIEMIEDNKMPLNSYTIIHSDAILTPSQKTLLVNWAKQSIILLSDTLNTTP